MEETIILDAYTRYAYFFGIIFFLITISFLSYKYIKDHENFTYPSDNLFACTRIYDKYSPTNTLSIKEKAFAITCFVFICFFVGSIIGVLAGFFWIIVFPFILIYGLIFIILSWKEKITIKKK